MPEGDKQPRSRFAISGLLLVVIGAALGILGMRAVGKHTSSSESHTVVEGVRKVLQLATVEMQISDYQVRRDSKDLWGFVPVSCDKTIVAFYRGKITAGFKLEDRDWGLATSVDGVMKKITVRLPPPQIMGVDVKPPDLFLVNGSICNGIEPEDYQRLHADTRRAAERAAIGAGILTRAQANARQLLGELGRPFGWEVEVIVAEAPPAPTPVDPKK
jgi:hypothetical protein